MRRLAVLLVAMLVTSIGVTAATPVIRAEGSIDSFRPLASLNTPGEVAEIVAATPDGNTLFYTNAGDGWIGVVDITNAAEPEFLTTIEVDGEPTSVDISADGEWAVAAVITREKEEGEPPVPFTPGQLVLIDVATRTLAGTIDIGVQPDSLKLFEIDGVMTALVAIENEPFVVEDGMVTDGEEPGLEGDISGAGVVQLVAIDEETPASSPITNVELPEGTLEAADCFFPDDPQPEFIAPSGTTAAVSLQENNCVAIIDVAAETLEHVFSVGVVADKPADLVANDSISFTDTYPADVAGEDEFVGGRFPDGIVFDPSGAYLYTANEGEFDFSGGRGISAFSSDGELAWDDAGEIEATAVQYSHYGDGRSDAKGVEIEGAAVGTFDGTDFLVANAERGAFVVVYNIEDPANPEFVQILPTGVEPEGIITIPSRSLFLTSDEASGTITIFQGVDGPYTPPLDEPIVRSAGVEVPWSALSGLAAAPDGSLHAIPDNAAPSEIYRIEVGEPFAELTRPVQITRDGEPFNYDGEGIAIDTSVLASDDEGWWIASEGNAAFGDEDYLPNLLVQLGADGVVMREVVLPADVDSPEGGAIRSNGYEGVTVSEDGRYVLAAIQRQYADEGSAFTRIARLDLESLELVDGLRYMGDWEFFLYPLDEPVTDGSWVGLSEITTIGADQYAVIERDNQFARFTHIKKVYAFSLEGLEDGDTIAKAEVADVLDAFMPHEKIEGLAVLDGEWWISLDNDGGEVPTMLVNFGALEVPDLPGSSFTYELQFRWTMVTWPGADGVTPLDALSGSGPVEGGDDILQSITAMYGWEPADESWTSFFPGAADIPGVNTLISLETGGAYWIAIDDEEGIEWTIPLELAE